MKKIILIIACLYSVSLSAQQINEATAGQILTLVQKESAALNKVLHDAKALVSCRDSLLLTMTSSRDTIRNPQGEITAIKIKANEENLTTIREIDSIVTLDLQEVITSLDMFLDDFATPNYGYATKFWNTQTLAELNQKQVVAMAQKMHYEAVLRNISLTTN